MVKKTVRLKRKERAWFSSRAHINISAQYLAKRSYWRLQGILRCVNMRVVIWPNVPTSTLIGAGTIFHEPARHYLWDVLSSMLVASVEEV